MNITYQDETPWLFELGDFLNDRGLTSSDVTQVVMYVKNNADDADGSALVSKTQSGGDIAFTTEGDAVQVDIVAADFGASKMEIDGTYYVYLGFTATGYTGVYLEAPLKDQQVTIIQDGIRS